MSAIQADYRTTKHIPSRKCYQLILEVPEEEFPNVCQVLGYPKTGENTYVGIALLTESATRTPSTTSSTLGSDDGNISQQTEGDKLRTRAVMLCKDKLFQRFAHIDHTEENEEYAVLCIREWCNIKSRSELATNLEAQQKFKELLAKFDAWKLGHQYSDNLNRY